MKECRESICTKTTENRSGYCDDCQNELLTDWANLMQDEFTEEQRAIIDDLTSGIHLLDAINGKMNHVQGDTAAQVASKWIALMSLTFESYEVEVISDLTGAYVIEIYLKEILGDEYKPEKGAA